ncbi:hypothetical protein C5O00_09630 [Pukyongia salina]|uniref:SGNH/GDSL hydrolase family protein n=1 Tax=Pukyongia salina TaxID=2094025 RepID=A0A2S0HXK3_9FLAO|nr:hypothetical protein [Pukyongia salina]AVI51417.1 hypothetical protein C5O00_09630 [Pukyongia salina]
MRRFLLKITLFSLLPILLFLTAELLIRFSPNAFIAKAEYIQNNKNIEALILGSSHTQQAIDPSHFTIKAANLAYNGQDLSINEDLYHRYKEELPQLKYLIVEIDYHTLEFRQPEDYFRDPWYFQYHGLKRHPIRPITKYSMYASSPKFFNNFLLDKLNRDSPVVQLNEWGFETNRFWGEFKDMEYDEKKIDSLMRQLPTRHAKISLENLNNSKRSLGRIIQDCNEKNITLVFIATPMYKTFERHKIEPKERHRSLLLDSLMYVYKNLIYLDFEYDERFDVTHFRDEDHLNPKGAMKFTRILNDTLFRLKQ